MTDQRYVMGLFTNENEAAQAIHDLGQSSWDLHRVHGPFHSHTIEHALKQKKSRVGWFTLIGGLTGFFTGVSLATFCSVQWNLIVSGKPVIALIPFIVVGFEFTILFGVFGTVIGLLTQARLPNVKPIQHYDPLCSSDHFGVIATCSDDQSADLVAFFEEKGGKTKIFDDSKPD